MSAPAPIWPKVATLKQFKAEAANMARMATEACKGNIQRGHYDAKEVANYQPQFRSQGTAPKPPGKRWTVASFNAGMKKIASDIWDEGIFIQHNKFCMPEEAFNVLRVFLEETLGIRSSSSGPFGLVSCSGFVDEESKARAIPRTTVLAREAQRRALEEKKRQFLEKRSESERIRAEADAILAVAQQLEKDLLACESQAPVSGSRGPDTGAAKKRRVDRE